MESKHKPYVTNNFENDFNTAVELRRNEDCWYEIFLNNMVKKHNKDFFEVKNKIDELVKDGQEGVYRTLWRGEVQGTPLEAESDSEVEADGTV